MKEKCNDAHCPVHGSLSLRGRSFTGTVLSTKMQRTAIVQWEFKRTIPKFERYEKRKSKVKVHNPDCLNIKKGDIVATQDINLKRRVKRKGAGIITMRQKKFLVLL